jgi:MFS family permease
MEDSEERNYDDPEKQEEEQKVRSLWTPLLNHQTFFLFWIGLIVTNIGNSMQVIGSSWLMTTLTHSPFLIAMIQASTSLAIVLFTVPTGALSDIFDRRKFLLFIRSWMLIVALILSILTIYNIITPSILLILTFALGIGIAMNMPMSILAASEMVSRTEVHKTITLVSVAANIGIAMGPLIGGLILINENPGYLFLLNALTIVAMIVIIYRWRRTRALSSSPPKTEFPPEHVMDAIKSGLHYVYNSPQAQSMFVRVTAFAFFGSIIPALLPVLASQQTTTLGVLGYGLLLSSFGAGSIIGGITLYPILRWLKHFEQIVTLSIILLAFVMLVLSFVNNLAVLSIVMMAAGSGWIFIISSLHYSMYKSVPKWVGARGLSIYLLIYQGSIALGSVIWGLVAQYYGVQYAFLFAAIGTILSLSVIFKYKLTADLKDINKTPSRHWPEPMMVIEPNLHDGPVLVKLEYRIHPNTLDDFLLAIIELRRVRLRDGAINWGLYRDDSDPNLYYEIFTVGSWGEHMHQHHERLTVEDRKIEDRVNSFIMGNTLPIVSHLIAVPLTKKIRT